MGVVRQVGDALPRAHQGAEAVGQAEMTLKQFDGLLKGQSEAMLEIGAEGQCDGADLVSRRPAGRRGRAGMLRTDTLATTRTPTTVGDVLGHNGCIPNWVAEYTSQSARKTWRATLTASLDPHRPEGPE